MECTKQFLHCLKKKWYQIEPKEQFFFSIFILVISIFIYYNTIRNLLNQENLRGMGDSVFQLLIVVIMTLAFVSYTYQESNEMRFIEALSDLVQEMIDNTVRLTEDSIEEQIKKIPLKLKSGDWAGFDKWPSFTNWNSISANIYLKSINDYHFISESTGNFYLKYLPTTNYYFFVSQGLFNSKFANKIDDGLKQLIAKSYFKYSKISIDIQILENMKLGYKRILPEDYRKSYYDIIDPTLKMYYTTDFLRESYNVIKTLVDKYPEIKKDTEGLKMKLKM